MTISRTLALGCALGLCLYGSTAFANNPPTNNPPKGQTYATNVFSSRGGAMFACFVFDESGTLLVDGLPPEIYRFDELDTQPGTWQAGPGGPLAFSVSFHGTTGGAAGETILGNGVSSEGVTFILQGVLNPSCIGSSASRRGGAQPAWR
jgi:hypothetical protein